MVNHSHPGVVRAVWMLLIVLVSVGIGIGLSWRLPELDLSARDWLTRRRGSIEPPPEIVIIAIDEASIARLGRFPWPRVLMAKCLDQINAAQPKVIALDVLYSEPSTPADDKALAGAIGNAKNVVVATQLIKTIGDDGEPRTAWLRPIPEIEKAAAAVGHVNVVPGYDGVLRGLLLLQGDDEGDAYWAMPAETIRIAESIHRAPLKSSSGVLEIGRRQVPVEETEEELVLGASVGVERIRPLRLQLDFVGPGGSFMNQTYRFSDVLEGKIDPAKFRDKYVLIGATAAALGDRMATPFIYSEKKLDARTEELTSGVEILANSLHTILRERYYSTLPDCAAIFLTILSATSVCLAMSISQGRWEGFKLIAVLLAPIPLIWPIAFLIYTRWLIFLPITSLLTAGLTAVLLVLLKRTIAANASLETQINELASLDEPLGGVSEGESFAFSFPNDPAKVIVKIAGVDAAAILTMSRDGHRILAACFGAEFHSSRLTSKEPGAAFSVSQAISEEVPASVYFEFSKEDSAVNRRALVIKLGAKSKEDGELVLAYEAATRPSNEPLMVAREIASSFHACESAPTISVAVSRGRYSFAGLWPRGAAWKTQLLRRLQRRMITRSLFVERALQSVDDGLLLATADGVITFANPRAAAIFGVADRGLVGGDLFARLENGDSRITRKDHNFTARQMLFRLLVERGSIERELTIRRGAPRHYVVRLSAVGQNRDGSSSAGPALGIVAALSDVTKQHELQQAKNDVMALVSHELRTPLTAIQGISEVLTRYDVDPARRFEMHMAIHDESKRLAQMIDEYLDLTRIETGARPLRLEPLRVTQVLERVLLLLEPVAAEREIRISRRFAPNLPALTADADLIARAVTNLLANAVKFSAPRHDVMVEAAAENEFLKLEIKDQGCGIPPESIPLIFEKFYRVPRIEDADDHGTGMGLAFVWDIAQLHGGHVSVESEPGVGSVFTLRLPFVRNLNGNQDVETASLNR